MTRILFALSLVAAILAGCGSSRPAAPAIAVVNDEPISQSEYEQNVVYAGEFFAAAGQGGCSTNGTPCAALHRQVLRRLLEQRVIEQYAQVHHITPSTADQRRVEAQIGVFAAPDSPAGKLLAHRQISRAFIRSVLLDQLMVQKVETSVLPPVLDRGQSYRLRIVTIPVRPQGDRAAFAAALDLATNGGAAPEGSSDRTEWLADFRLGGQVRSLLVHAQIGQYIGPIRRSAGYRDFQLLGQRWGRYGRPARERLETSFFRKWLDNRVRAAHPACYSGSKRIACPGQNA